MVEKRRNWRRYWQLLPLVMILLAAMGLAGVASAGVPTNNVAAPAAQTQGDAGAKAQQGQQAQQFDKDKASVALSNAEVAKTGEVGNSKDTTNSPQVFVNKAAVPVPTDRHASAGTATHLYVLGGEYYTGSAYAITSTVQRYDPAADTWAFVAPMPASFTNMEACTMNGKIYVPGGYSGTGPPFNSTFYIYDIATNTWSTGLAVPAPATLWYAVQCNAANNKVYVIGGFDGTGATGTNKIYDVATNTWSTGLAMPLPRYGPDSGLIGGAIYVAGGADATGVASTAVQRYDIAANTWSTVAPMAVGGLYGAAGVYNNQLYVSGGGFATDGSAY